MRRTHVTKLTKQGGAAPVHGCVDAPPKSRISSRLCESNRARISRIISASSQPVQLVPECCAADVSPQVSSQARFCGFCSFLIPRNLKAVPIQLRLSRRVCVRRCCGLPCSFCGASKPPWRRKAPERVLQSTSLGWLVCVFSRWVLACSRPVVPPPFFLVVHVRTVLWTVKN